MLQSPPSTPTRIGGAPIDAPFISHDGKIWPVERSRMTTPEHIHALMAHDMLDHIGQVGIDAGVAGSDLRRRGWLDEQIRTHGPQATELLQRRLAKLQASRYAL